MGPVVIVVVDPGLVGAGPGLVGGVVAGVGPLGGQGAVEALNLAVRLWPVGAGVFVDDLAEGVIEAA